MAVNKEEEDYFMELYVVLLLIISY